MNTVGAIVSLIMGFYDAKNDLWDYLKCDVAYDGDVNTVARFYTVSDRYSLGPGAPDVIGVSKKSLIPDEQQDWKLDETNSMSSCPYLQKCVF